MPVPQKHVPRTGFIAYDAVQNLIDLDSAWSGPQSKQIQ